MGFYEKGKLQTNFTQVRCKNHRQILVNHKQ